MLAKEVKDLDEEVFERTLKELEKNGPFDNGNKSVDPKFTDKRINRNNGIYEGQVNAKGEIEGRGIRIWSVGAIYEGFWHSGMPNGRGRDINPWCEMYISESISANKFPSPSVFGNTNDLRTTGVSQSTSCICHYAYDKLPKELIG